MKRIFITALGMTLIWVHCGQNPLSSGTSISYTPLAVGDITQLIWVQDSSTLLIKVTGTTKRSDQKTVYIEEWQYGTRSSQRYYYYVNDGYYIATALEPVKDDTLLMKSNQFNEQRLAKSYPQDNDTWIHTPGDADSYFFIAHALDSVQVPAGAFKDAFAFTLGNFLTTVYGKGVGWLGTAVSSSSSAPLDYVCTYKKISGKEYGHLWPAKDFEVRVILRQNEIFKESLIPTLVMNGKLYLINGLNIGDVLRPEQ